LIKSVERSDALTLGTLDHFSHFKLIVFGLQAPSRGNPKLGPLGQDSLRTSLFDGKVYGDTGAAGG